MASSIPGSVAVEFAGHELHLLADRAIWWPKRATLVVADLHFGKSASFRATGVPVPAGATTKDLRRLSKLIRETAARRLVILGDFLHARAGRQPEVFGAIEGWRGGHADVSIVLVRGNHDRSAGRVPEEWDIHQVEEPFEYEGLSFLHNPDCGGASQPSLAGHVHPVIGLQDYDGSSVALPCFVVDAGCVTLPAFGTFTGGHRVSRAEGRRIFVAGPGRVIAFPAIPNK